MTTPQSTSTPESRDANAPVGDETDLNLRQRTLIPSIDSPVLIAGVGAVGLQIARQLVTMGAKEIHLVDPDIVEPHNVWPQGYSWASCKLFKVEAAKSILLSLAPQNTLTISTLPGTIEYFWERSIQLLAGDGLIVFCCMDSMEATKFLWEAVESNFLFFGDVRVGGETLRSLAESYERTPFHYPSTLYSDDEAYEARCTSRMTFPMANMAASFLLEGQFLRWLRDEPFDRDVIFNAAALEIMERSS